MKKFLRDAFLTAMCAHVAISLFDLALIVIFELAIENTLTGITRAGSHRGPRSGQYPVSPPRDPEAPGE